MKLDYCHDFRPETPKQVITFWLLQRQFILIDMHSYTIRPETYKTIVSFDFFMSSWVSRHKVILKDEPDTVKHFDLIKTLTAWPSSSVSPSSGVEEDGESDPAGKY